MFPYITHNVQLVTPLFLFIRIPCIPVLIRKSVSLAPFHRIKNTVEVQSNINVKKVLFLDVTQKNRDAVNFLPSASGWRRAAPRKETPLPHE